MDNLFLNSDISWEMWYLMFHLFGARWVTPKTVFELLACWKGHFGKQHNIQIWKALPSCWSERHTVLRGVIFLYKTSILKSTLQFEDSHLFQKFHGVL